LLQVEIYGLLEGMEHVLGTISKVAGNIPATVKRPNGGMAAFLPTKSSAKLYRQSDAGNFG